MFSDDNIWPLKLWLFLAALNGNHCGISSAGLISCSLTQPLSLSHFVCPCLIKQLPMRTPLSLLKSYVTLNLASHHPKPCDSLEAAKAFLKLSTLASFFACVCKWVWGLDARGCSIKTSCGCFYQLNLYKSTCTDTKHKLWPAWLCCEIQAHSHKSRNVSVQEMNPLVSCITSTDG